ncbi:MAG: hypothetical protein M3112_10355 [Actinomycetia bacterium]|nr:hypothetical protein [Actinomycetes bacterium]
MKWWAIVGVALSTLLVGCGEAGLLDGVGDATREYVEGDQITTTTIVPVAAGTGDEGLIGAADAKWFNDDIPNQMSGTPDQVVRGVWERELKSRFVQSSRAEIVAALPSIMFPGLVPENVEWITSQLVFDETTGALDRDTTAAFGLWISDPYQSDAARAGVLRVGRAAADLLPTRSDIVPIIVPDGISLSWTEDGHRYELFCRSDISVELCSDVADSAVPLASLLTR